MPNNTTIGIGGLLDYAKISLNTVNPIIGGNFIGFLFLIPMFFMLLVPLSLRFGPMAAFTTSSFICALVAIPLVMLSYVHPIAIWLFMTFTVIGALGFYLQSRS
jgi:hypothetical protein